MKERRAYALAFTVGLCCASAGVLTFARAVWRERIEANCRYAKVRALTDAFGLLVPGMEREQIESTFARCVEPARLGGIDYYVGRRDGMVVGYGLDIAGRGRYGPIRGILAVAADRRSILALRIYEQNETPGLGGRIASPTWLGQFGGKPLSPLGLVFSDRASGRNVVKPVTGASKTMYSLSRILNAAIARFLAGGEDMVELRPVQDPNHVSKATPGLPKNEDKPPHLRPETLKRPPFMVPAGGAVNLALHRPVSASEEPILGWEDLEKITDGDKRSTAQECVDFGPGRAHVQIDLGAERTIYAVAVWHDYKNPNIYNDVIVQVSGDPEFQQGVRTLFNNDHDNSSGLGQGRDPAFIARWWAELIDARGPTYEGTRCRYVRVWTHAGLNRIDTRFVEIAVYGRDQ